MKRDPASLPAAVVGVEGWPRRGSGLASLYRRWRAPLVRLLHGRSGSQADAEDTAQQVFAQMAASGRLPEPGRELAYLNRCARHLQIDSWRQRGGERALNLVSTDEGADALDVLPAGDATDPMNAAHHRQQLARLDAAIAELPERQREAFSLHTIDGLSQEEVARRMGISLRMVSRHISRALAYCELRLHYGSVDQMERLRDGAEADGGIAGKPDDAADAEVDTVAGAAQRKPERDAVRDTRA